MQNDEKISIEDVLKSLNTEISDTDLDYIYVYLESIMDDLTHEQITALALALEKIDKNFNDYEE